MGEGQPFSRFKEDGLITIGYSHREVTPAAAEPRLDLVILLMTASKVTAKVKSFD